MRAREKYVFLKSIVALALICLCLIAAQWQYHRGVDRHHRNFLIEKNIAAPNIPLTFAASNLAKNEWRSVNTEGIFDANQTILLRNRYFEGKYGFEFLTLFTSSNGEKFWVDRGWIVAGKDALTAPVIPNTPSGTVEITGRLRLDTSLPRGSFFALPESGSGLISKWNAQNEVVTEGFYLDLLSGSTTDLTPKVSAQLPELSDGPHMAYALQWVFFAGLVGYGRILIRRSR
ncbi:MAG: SURF1 family protein [Actinobacteria bacterium]|nr:SURF1 family protein [Actinomycetota bacterium]